jgi:hypothetical protein
MRRGAAQGKVEGTNIRSEVIRSIGMAYELHLGAWNYFLAAASLLAAACDQLYSVRNSSDGCM